MPVATTSSQNHGEKPNGAPAESTFGCGDVGGKRLPVQRRNWASVFYESAGER
jgi:hypothetical protein